MREDESFHPYSNPLPRAKAFSVRSTFGGVRATSAIFITIIIIKIFFPFLGYYEEEVTVGWIQAKPAPRPQAVLFSCPAEVTIHLRTCT